MFLRPHRFMENEKKNQGRSMETEIASTDRGVAF